MPGRQTTINRPGFKQRLLERANYSKNIEDRRNDPRGAQRLQMDDPSIGDLTFHPPRGKTKVMPYSDPEGEFNRARRDTELLRGTIKPDYKKAK